MKHRKLRIAWSVAWGAVAVLLVVQEIKVTGINSTVNDCRGLSFRRKSLVRRARKKSPRYGVRAEEYGDTIGRAGSVAAARLEYSVGTVTAG